MGFLFGRARLAGRLALPISARLRLPTPSQRGRSYGGRGRGVEREAARGRERRGEGTWGLMGPPLASLSLGFAFNCLRPALLLLELELRRHPTPPQPAPQR